MRFKGINSYSGSLLVVVPLVAVVLLALVIACEDDSTRPIIPSQQITGRVIDFSECGGFVTDDPIVNATYGPSCILYSYNDTTNTLSIRHENAIFNCCIDEITAEFTVIDNVIVISEDDVESDPCDCVCPYDVDIEISNLPAGYYLVIFTGPYLRDPIQFTLNLIEEPSGHLCADSTVPVPADTAWGAFLGMHGCGVPEGGVEVPESLEFYPHVTWEYDEDNTLKFGANNTVANCCTDNFMVLFSIEDNVINMTAVDSSTEICLCICAIGFDVAIYNLPMGQYHVFLYPEPGSVLPTDFWIDLESEPSGYYCPNPVEVSEP
ncbi:MAG: hypothetical protein JSV52_08785 [Candidatus Zixiibacteriota bacterium]|nr:MAG: hypothetical protein JSV52_08785 [candidate division Zixibacteria bacterium]